MSCEWDYPQVTKALPLEDYRLELEFADGEQRTFDVSKFFCYPAFAPLKDVDFFKTVFVERGRPMWGDRTIDISPNMLADCFEPSGYDD
jgi:hypothetical protein